MRFDPAGAARTLPVAALAAVGLALAWIETGSTASADWLPYAFFGGLLLAAVLAAGGAGRPHTRELVAVGALPLLAIWGAISIAWSAVPPPARDEAGLAGFYPLALLLPPLALGGSAR